MNLDHLTPDRRNANKGTERGLGMLEQSLRHCGAGRSILVDRNGQVIAGNKTLERAQELGLGLVIVDSDGTSVVAVRRTDLDLEHDARARELAIADNRVAQVDLEWDLAELAAERDDGGILDDYWFDAELDLLLAAEGRHSASPPVESERTVECPQCGFSIPLGGM